MRTWPLLLVAGCGAGVVKQPATPAPVKQDVTYFEYSKPIHVEVKTTSLYLLPKPACIVVGESRPILVAPIVDAVVRSLAGVTPDPWRHGYAVFVVDATKEWPDEALSHPTYPLDVHPTIERIIGRPTIGIDPRTNTGMLYVATPGKGSTKYCIRVSDDGARVTVDAFLQSVSD